MTYLRKERLRELSRAEGSWTDDSMGGYFQMVQDNYNTVLKMFSLYKEKQTKGNEIPDLVISIKRMLIKIFVYWV